jgi:transglutaminase-like putative cysteine protease
MNGWRTAVLAILLVLPLPRAVPAAPAAPHERRFTIRYTATIAAPPAGAKSIRIWLPYPRSDAWQTIRDVVIEAPYSYSVLREPEYGNRILYLESHSPQAGRVVVTMRFEVLRLEEINRPGGAQHGVRLAAASDPPLSRFRRADRLIPIDGKIAALAQQVTRGLHGDAAKARAIYDYVTTHLRYDKSGTGWGRGDALWACAARHGNCTDFHSLLIGMARAVGIPAKFEIGLPVPENSSAGSIAGYHCWAALYLDGVGWVPVDSAEASQAPAKRDYFFGAVDANRVRLTTGRDLTLAPPQHAGPLNFFVYPYVEVGGKPFAGVTESFAFQDLPLHR